MTKLTEKLYGAGLIALAFSLNAADVNAQTCTEPPSCATLGFDKSSSDCAGHSILKCPFNKTEVYCDTGSSGSDDNEAIAIGHIAYTDGTTSPNRIASKTPLGVVFNVSGLVVALDDAGSSSSNVVSQCSNYSSGGFATWQTLTKEQLNSINTNLTKINSTLNKLSATQINGRYYYENYSGITIGSSSSAKVRCYIDINTLNETPVVGLKVGDVYYKDGIACGRIVSLDTTKQHGTMRSQNTVSGSTKTTVSDSCNAKSTCGADWGIASKKNSPLEFDEYYWTGSGCCDSYDCDYGHCDSGYCQAAF